MTTIEELSRELQRLETRISAKVSSVLYRAEIDTMKTDIEKLEGKMDRMIEGQLTSQRTANLQLVAIIVTLAVAAWGALS